MNKELDFVRGMFDRIAPKYDFLNRLLSLRQDVYWRTQMVESATLRKNSRILDVACGTSDVALEASRHLRGEARITGLDFSINMLRLGKRKLLENGNRTISLVNGDALHLPLKSGIFDAVFIAFGIRNIMDRKGAILEFIRTLKPGGRVVILELTTPESGVLRTLYLAYFQKVLPRIGSFFSRDKNAYSYLPESVLKFPRAACFAGIMRQAGLEKVRYKKMTLGIVTLFVGKRPG